MSGDAVKWWRLCLRLWMLGTHFRKLQFWRFCTRDPPYCTCKMEELRVEGLQQLALEGSRFCCHNHHILGGGLGGLGVSRDQKAGDSLFPHLPHRLHLLQITQQTL